MAFLLDTNTVSDFVRHPRGVVAARIAGLPAREVCTSIIVAAELRYGVCKRPSARLAAQLDGVLAWMRVMPFQAPADGIYGEVRAALEKQGSLIGARDLFIAAHALALNCTLVTDNEREFSRVPGLAVVNWLRD